ncbi:MAG: gliding motility-associated C-terminal domain-containing protein [Saprospiraceae bacterium]
MIAKGESFMVRVVVHNDAQTATSGLQVAVSPTVDLTLTGATAPAGTNYAAGLWNIGPALGASVDSLVLILTYTADEEGPHFVQAEVSSLTEIDLDSTPGDGVVSQDDYSSSCVTVPIRFCAATGDTITLTAATGLSGYQWYLDQGLGALPITGATSSTYQAYLPGQYTYSGIDPVSGCLAGTCCPIVMDEKCMDLALYKKLANGQPEYVEPGDLVTFTITIVNQGDITADNIVLSDYIPAQMAFVAQAGWTAASSIATRTLNAGDELPAAGLLPGELVNVDIQLQVNSPMASNTVITNWAEITSATDENGDIQPDVDSTPDSDPNNDTYLVDNLINDNGKANGDEDDHDPASVIVEPFDLALYKQLANGQSVNVTSGDLVTFTITVVNQGLIAADNIDLADYFDPSQLTLADANWTADGTGRISLINPLGPLAPGASVSVNVTFMVATALPANTVILNTAEISAATDDAGNPQVDIDSDPDNTNDDLFLVDDDINGDGKNSGDEDDHDIAQLIVDPFDLALYKTLAAGQPSLVEAGDKVTFTIHVVNQGAITASGIQITDYIPSDMTFVGGDNPSWAIVGNKASITLPGTLAPNASTSVDIVLTVNSPLSANTVIINKAEISAALDGAGNPQIDIDSDPDNTDDDLYLVDNDINGNGKGGGDEDDHDIAEVTVQPFDLAMYKQLANGQSAQVNPGDKVTFTLTVVNQGLITAGNIQLVDYVPTGMTFLLADNAGWSASGSNFVTTLPGTLAPGASTSVNVVLTVNNPLAANTKLVNWAEIASATDDAGNPQEDIDSNPNQVNEDTFLVDDDITGDGKNGGDEDDHDKAEVVVQPFDLALFKQLANGQSMMVEPGDDVTFTITVVNQGAITATNIEITDFVPATMTFAGASNPMWSFAGGKATRTIAGPLAPGASTSVDIVLNVNSPLASGTEITNWAEISDAQDTNGVSQPDIDSNPDDVNNDLFLEDNYIDGDGKNGGDEDDHDPASVIVQPFDLALVKQLAVGQSATVEAGDKVTFTITVTNQGAIAAGNILLADYVPAQMTFVPADNPGWALAGSTATFTLPGTLAPGASTSTNVVLTVNSPMAANTVITNWAEIAAATDDAGNPQVDIDSDPDQSNNDNFLVDNDITGNGKQGGDEDDHDPASVTVEPFDLALYKTLGVGQSAMVEPGDKVTFTINVVNQGQVAAANIEVTDYVPTNMTFVPGDNPGWTLAAGKASRILPGVLAPGATTSANIVLTVNAPVSANTVIQNWAEISAATDDFGNPQVDIDSDPDNNNDDLFLADNEINGDGKNGGDEDDHDVAEVTVEPFDLALVKQLAVGQPLYVEPGDLVTFTITVTNQGLIAADNIQLVDYVPSNMTFVPASNPTWAFAAGKATSTITGALAPGASVSRNIVLRVNSPLAANTEIVNWAEIASATDDAGNPQEDIDSNPNQVNEDKYLVDDYIDGDGKNGGDEDDHDRAVVITQPFDLALDKVLSPGQSASVEPGDKVSFTIRVYNQGMIAASNIELTDYVPTGMTFVAADNPGWSFSAGKAKTTITSVLAPGGLTSRTLVLTVNNPLAAGTSLQNWAEISAATDDAGNPQVDIDSSPDDANNDKYVNNNDISGNGKANEDEDDHDQETVVVKRFDLALTKTLDPAQNPEVIPGMKVNYDIIVYNQGEYAAYNVVVSDYLPANLDFLAGDNPGWSLVAGKPTYTIAGPIAPGASVNVPLVLMAEAPILGTTEVINWAEISDARDNDNVTQIDDDSTPDTNPDNDTYLQDNEVSGNGKNGEDEDDHDPATITIKIFDLALYKQLAPFEDMSVEPGETVTFNIFVVNQGMINADNIEVTDYIPVGMTLMDPSWTQTGQIATKTLTAGAELGVNGLAPGQTVMVPIMLKVPDPIGENTKLINWAEISDFTDDAGFDMVDYDSDPDQDVANDKFLIDDYIGGDAKNNGDDEDDHDQAYVMYRVYDLALRKTVDNDCPVRPGDTIQYTITVFNQGTEAVQDVVLVDSLASGVLFNQNIQLFGWHLDGVPNRVTYEIDDPILPGDSAKVTLFYIIKPGCLYYNDLWNFAEIAHFDNLNGMLKDTADIDSKPDKFFWNDNVVNDIIDDDGTLDEDDHDIQIPPIFDLAVRQIELVNLPVKIGQDVPYEITVFNQGNITAYDIQLKQFLPFGFILSPNDGDGWADIGNLMATVTIPGPLVPGDSVKLQVLLRVTEDAHEGMLMNYVEIQGAVDVNGKDMTPFDFDSDPDMDPLNDLLTNDVIDKCKQIEEDDNDKSTVELFDLALRKTPYERQRVQWGDDVTFTITVFNQSPLLSAENIDLVDYLPTGFSLSPNDANGWVNSVAGQITNNIPGPIAPGDSVKVDVTLRVNIGAPGGDTDNFAEITSAFDTNGRDLTDYDFDSQPDNDRDNDVVVDNEIDMHDQGVQDEDDHDIAPIFVEIFDLALRKTTLQTEPVLYGQDVTFTITVFNQGNVPATDIEIRDSLPSGFKMKPANLGGWTMNASTLAYYKMNGPIAPGDSAKVDIILTVQEEASPFGLTNAAEIVKAKNELGQDRTGDDIDSWNDNNPNNDLLKDDVIDEQAKLNPGDDEDDHDVATVYMFDLALRKTTPVKKPVTVGDDVLFTIEVFNQGTVTAQNVAIIDHIPAGFVLSPLEADWVDMGGGIATSVVTGPIASLESDTIDILLRVAPDATAGFFTNFAEITSAQDGNGIDRTDFDVDSTTDEDKDNDAYVDDEINDAGDFDEDDHDGATVEVEIIDLALRKITQFKDMAPVKIGEDVSFAIEVFNQGSVTMYNIDIVDYIPAGFMLSPTDGNLWTVAGNNAYNTIAGPLLPGQKRSIGIVLRVTGAATAENLVNGAEIIGAQDPNGEERADDDRDSTPDENPANDDLVDDEVLQKPPVDEDDHDVEGVPVFDLALRKLPDFTGKVTVGDDIDFTITVFNQGNIPAANVSLVDYIPAGTGLSPNDANGWVANGNQATTLLAGPIAPGDSAQVTITLRVLPNATAGIKVNRTEITGAEDGLGNDMTDRDLDSTPDDIVGNDNEKDNVINENGVGTNDEDDHDPAPFEIEIIDIALRKILDPANIVNPISVGDDVIFEIEVFNQGSVTLQGIELIDHYPPGFILSVNDANGWLDNGDGTAFLAFPYTLPPGQSATVGIVLTLDAKVQLGNLFNTAEVTHMEDGNGVDRSDDDRDSTPDTDKDNDNLVDDEIFSGGDPDEDDHDVATVFVDGFDLALVKKVADSQSFPVKPGDQVLFQVTVFNQGTYDAYNVQITDAVPTGLTVIDAAWTQTGNTAQMNNPLAFLAAGDSIVIDLLTMIDNDFMGYTLLNRAEISEADDNNNPFDDFPEDVDSQPDTNPDNDIVGGDDVTDNSNGDEDDHDPAQIEVDQDFDLALYKVIAKGQKPLVLPGDTVRYTIFVINQGTLNAYNIQVRDYVPADMTFVTALNTALETSNPFNWASNQTYTVPGPLAPGDSTSIDILLIVDENTQLEHICNFAEIAFADNDQNPNNALHEDEDSTPDQDDSNDIYGGDNITDNTANDEDDHDGACVYLKQIFDLALIKQTAASTVKPGDNVPFTITVTNQGSQDAHDVDITDYVPSGFLFNAGDNPQWTDNGNGTISATITGPVLVGTSQQVNLILQVDPNFLGTSITNVAEITAASKEAGGPDALDEDSTPDNDPDNDTVGGDDVTDNSNGDEDDHDPATVEVEQIFDLALIKTTQVVEAEPGDTVAFTISLFNQGTQVAYDVNVTDEIPTGFLFDASLNTGWSDNGNGTVTTVLAGPFYPSANQVTQTTIQLVIDPTYQGRELVNLAEISQATNTSGGSPVGDIDSTPDSDPDNDTIGGDDVIDNSNGDEDDHDPAPIQVKQIFDLALIKTTDAVKVKREDDIMFTITVTNQGTLDAYDIDIVDYYGDLDFSAAANAGWSDNGNGTASTTIPGPVAPGATASVDIVLTVPADFSGTSIENLSEISDASETSGGPSAPDEDSTPDDDPDNDVFGGDDVTDNSNGDEDDHDPAVVEVDQTFDLALIKTTSVVEAEPGDLVPFQITVINQGARKAYDIEVRDYIPSGFKFPFGMNPFWTDGGDGTAYTSIDGPLAPGDSVTLNLTLFVDTLFHGQSLTNWAEIERAATEKDGPDADDIDSTPDRNPDNDVFGGDNVTDNSNGDEDDHDPATVPMKPVYDLALIKTSDVTHAELGDTIQYTITVFNQGNTPAYDIKVKDYIPSGFIFDFGMNTDWTDNGDGTAFTFIDGPLNGGQEVDLQISLIIDKNFTGLTLTNVAEIERSADEPNGPDVDDTDSTPNGDQDDDIVGGDDVTDNSNNDEDDHDPETIQVNNGTFDLALIKTTNATNVVPGDTVSFTFTVFNQGDVTAYNVEVTDYIPSGFDFVFGMNPGWTDNGNGTASTVIAGPLSGGQSTTRTIKLILDPAFSGSSITNLGEISQADDDQDPNNTPPVDVDSTPNDDPNDDPFGGDDVTDNSNGDEDDSDPATIPVGPAPVFDLALIKTTNATNVVPGDTVSFTFTVFNQGDVSAYNVEVTDYIPTGFDFVFGMNPGWTDNGNGTASTVIAGPLASGQSTTRTIKLILDPAFSGSSITNLGEISQADDDQDPNNTPPVDVDSTPNDDPNDDPFGGDDVTDNSNGDEDDSDPATIPVGPAPVFDLALIKTSATPTAGLGDTVTFTIKVFNQGNVNAYNVEVTDYIPNGFLFVFGMNPGWTDNGNGSASTIIAGPLAVNSITERTIKLIIDPAFTGNSLTNLAEISAADDDQNPNNTPPTDVDSTPDDNPGNDTIGGDNVIDNTNNDEDDHDPAIITLEDCKLVLKDVPADVTIECDQVGNLTNPVSVQATGGCCDPVELLLNMQTIPSAQCPQSYMLVRTWTAKDACGHEITQSQMVQVKDSQAPVFTAVPASLTVECDAIPSAPVIGVDVKATDNCDPAVSITIAETILPGQCKDSYTIRRTWTAKDDCGNAATATQQVTVRDTKAPVFTTVPADLTLSCGQNAPAPAPVTAADNCDTQVAISFSETVNTSGNCDVLPALVRKWIATDNCGNTAVYEQKIYIQDNAAPVFIGVPTDVTVECDQVPAPWTPEVEDACDKDVQVNYTQEVISGNCPGNYTLVRRWTATDDCGNQSTAVQNVTVRDTKAPVITFTHPDLIGLGNGDTVFYHCTNQPIFDLDDATVVDNCDPNPTVTFTDDLVSDDGCKKVLHCYWTATDACGNQSQKAFYMVVGDLSAPVISGVPADVTISCDQAVPAVPTVTVTDDCDTQPTLAYQQTEQAGSCPQNRTLVRTWTATDDCGNVTKKTQRIVIRDTHAPDLVVMNPALNGKKSGDVIKANCGNEPVFVQSDIKANDNCDPNPTVSMTKTETQGNCLTDGYFKKVTYTWTASDACGNVTTFVIHVELTDTEKPVFTFVPANVTISCSDPEPTTQPTATDNCDNDLTMTATSSITQLPCGYLIQRSWTATDDCGNKATVTQTVTVVDTNGPQIQGVPADLTVACDQVPVPPSTVTATDDCDVSPKLTYSEETPQQGSCAGSYTLIRKWTATDKCGNVTTKTQKVTVFDNQAPTFTFVPADATISCEQMVPGVGQAQADDNCDNDVTITVQDATTPGSCPNAYTVVRTFTATDDCGNTATAQQKITVQDKKAPVFVNVPANVTISCDDAVNLQHPNVTDNCDQDVTVTHTETKTNGQCANEYILTVVWTATDDCGNTATAQQVIKVEDNTAPTITPTHPAIAGVPSGSILTFNCDEVPVMDAGDVDAEDNCDSDPTVVFSELAQSGDCATDGYYTQLTCTWTATDDCGNASTYFVYIRITDTKKPFFTFVPSNQTIECGDAVPGGVATADDNCDNDVEVSVSESEKDLNCGYQIIRTFTATDDCGNTATAQQVITVTDTGAPVLVGVPADLTVDLTAGQSVPAPANVTATDECDNDVTVTFTEMEDTKDCGYLLIRTWTATDDCGNTAQATQMVSVDEGCPCEEPVLETIESVQPTCGQKDGSITILLDGNEADFDYTWLPNKGTPNAAGNSHTGLGAGTYTIIVSDPGSANCFIKLTVELEVDGTCTDTVYVNIPAADPYQLCIESVLDLVGDVASAGLCGYDTDAIESVDLNDNNGCLTIDPVDDFTGQTTICVIHCDDEVPANCDTTYIVVKIDAVKPCDDILTNSAVNLTITQCSALAETCINIPFASIGDYTITVNGVAYSGSMTSCGNGQGTMLAFGEGIFDLVITEISTSCTDEAVISVVCEEGNELIAVDDTGKTIKNKSNTINVLKNDIIPNNDLGDMYILTQPEHGIVKIEPNLLIKYTPHNEYCGPDQFEYVICNEVGCDTALVVIDVQCQSIFVKNGFSPNNDGVNDNFTIEGIESFPNNELTVFNRWGNQIFSQKGYKNNWNGTWDGADLPDGTYFYILKDGEGKTYSGFVQINR